MEDIITKNWGTGDIELHIGDAQQYMPTQIHIKEDGAKNNGPSICIVMSRPHSLLGVIHIYGQISVKMLNEALNEVGYKIEKIPSK